MEQANRACRNANDYRKKKNTFQHTHSKLPVHTSKDNIIKNPMEE